MDAETTSLEDVFLELTGDEPEAGEEETSGRADEDEDGTAAQAALEMAGDAPEEIASEEESTAHAHQPENGEEAVSYTHLDVYKRQRHLRQRAGRTGELYQQVVAGAALLHHVTDAVYLPRDTRKTLCHTA